MASKSSTDTSPGQSLRLPLAILQLLSASLLGLHVGLTEGMRQHGGPVLGLAVLLIMILWVSDAVLRKGWVTSALVACNTAVLVYLTEDSGAIEPWVYFEFILVMLMASCSPSMIQFSGLGAILCTVYGLSVYLYGSLLTEQGVLIPILIAMAMVYGRASSRVPHHAEKDDTAADQPSPESMRDALTGLPNRSRFLQLVWRAVAYAKNNDDFLFAVLFIDLDGFKPINDGLGHKAGDAVLIETARRLHACLRKGDTVARYGGDEFTLLVNNVNSETDAVRVAERVLRRVQEPIHAGKRVQIGASIGIALSTNIYEGPEDLIRHADVAMYRAKSQGKNQYVISDQLRDIEIPGERRLKHGG